MLASSIPVTSSITERKSSPTPPVHGLHGRLLFDDDPPARVWQADTRFIYLDELPGILARQAEWLKVVSRKSQDD